MLAFANQFGTTEIDNVIDVNNYLSFLTLIVVSMGILFEMPVASFLLTKAGLLAPKTLIKYWRHGIVVILILAAVITPTPDPVSQLIFATPLFILYILSIFISVLASPKKTKEEEEIEDIAEVEEVEITAIDENDDTE
jgi:sec-independent protein translocase protein TatC